MLAHSRSRPLDFQAFLAAIVEYILRWLFSPPEGIAKDG